MRPRWKKVLTDLWGNRTRSLLVVASITVGLFAIGVITTLYLVFEQDMRQGYAAVNPANIIIQGTPFDQDLVDHIARQPNVRQAEGIRAFQLRLQAGPQEWIAVNFRSINETGAINQVRVIEGRWPPAEREIVLEQSKFESANTQLGAQVNIELPSGKTRQMTVVGVIQDQTVGADGATGGFFTSPLQAYVHQDSLEWLEQENADFFNRLYITVDEALNTDRAMIEDVSAQVRDVLEENGVTVTAADTRETNNHPNRTLVEAIVGILFLLGFLVVFLSGFLITNMLQALLDQQSEQVGIMKTVGGRRRQITGVYLALLWLFGLLAFAVALPSANLSAFAMMTFMSAAINTATTSARLLPEVVALQLFLALAVPLVAGFVPIWQGANLSVQEALSGYRQDHLPRRTAFDRWLAGIRGLSRPMRISLRNTFRRKGRLILTLITLTLGGAVFIATFNVRGSLDLYIEQISNYFLADVNLFVDQPYRISRIQAELDQVPGVARVEGWAAARGQQILEDGSAGAGVQILAPPANSPLVTPILMEGRWIQPGDTNAITLNDHYLSSNPGLKLGDSVALRVNGKDTEWEVVGFFQLAGEVSGYLAYANYDYLAEMLGQTNRALAFRVVAEDRQLDADGQQVLAEAIENHLRARGIGIAEIETGMWTSQTAAEGFTILTAFLLSLAVLTAVVGSIGLAGTMSLNVMERTREIGVMRSIGASNPILMRMVIGEGVLIGMVSWLLGSLLAFPISSLLAESISRALFDAPSKFAFSPIAFVIWFLMVLVLSVLASVMPARKAANLTIREVLAYE